MKGTFRKSLIAIAVTAVFGTATAYAQDENGTHEFSQSYSLDQSSTHDQKVSFDKMLKLKTDISIRGRPTITGNIDIDSAAIAIVDNRQKNHDNDAVNYLLSNDASIADDVGSNASGNLGFNVAAGDNNQQDNAAALSATDASFVFGMADTEVFVNQLGHDNNTANLGVTNNASVGDMAFNSAEGNIGVNVTSGNNNQQKNALGASVSTSRYSQASVDSSQYSTGNTTANAGYVDSFTDTVDVSLSGPVRGRYSGSGQGSANLSLTGAVDQIGNVYPDNWANNANDNPATAHPTNQRFLGHTDLDTATQGGSDLNGDGGALAFGYTRGSAAAGPLGFSEAGDITLAANLAGTVTTTRWIAVMATNDASLTGGAFQNASGNIGVNISAGTGNQQANSLALAVAQPGTGGGGGGSE
ncbi:MAG TPA: adhesin [Rhodanobacter sp.]